MILNGFTIVGDLSEPPPFWTSSFMQQCRIFSTRPARSWIFELTRPCWTLPLRPKVRSKFCKHDRYDGPQSCTSLRRSCVRRFGTMPVFVKTAVTDMHRCDSCVMWQACAGYWKHLENRSVSSLHWNWDKLTQGQLLVLHFEILHLAMTRVE